jgi:hypothetical protein
MLAHALPRSLFRFAVLAALALVMFLTLGGSARAAEVGVNSDITWDIPHDQVDRSVALMKQSGVRWIRVNANWSAVETNGKGVINQGVIADYDYAVKAARAAGLQVLMPMADGVPYWASADPHKSRGNWNIAYRPRSMRDYADYARFIVGRYSPMGVHAYEVWNEENLDKFWPSGPSATSFVSMLQAAYPAIKAADQHATVVLGGLSGNDYPFLRKLYEAGARPYFDAVGVHPYTGVDPDQCWSDNGSDRKSVWAFCGLEEVHATMASHGDGAKPVWATEFGWSTSRGGVNEHEQAVFLQKAFHKLESYPWVTKAFWYGFRNVFFLHDNTSDREANFGLLRSNYTAKPALRALAAYAGPRSRANLGLHSVRTSLAVRALNLTAHAAAAGLLPVRSRWLATGAVSGAHSGRVTLRMSRWSSRRHRWERVARLHPRVDPSGKFSARLRTHFRGRYRAQAFFRGGPTAGTSRAQTFRS